MTNTNRLDVVRPQPTCGLHTRPRTADSRSAPLEITATIPCSKPQIASANAAPSAVTPTRSTLRESRNSSYKPWPNPGEPKMLATAGSRRALLPHPAAEPSTRVLLVEGEPDMIAARSHGLRAIATPGADSWRSSWAQLLSDRQVTIIMDCDEQGRMAAATIASDLSRISDVDVLDLAPDRNDGYDLTDRLLEGWQPEVPWP